MPCTKAERRKINRENAARSTGPKTPEGKSRSRMNARVHGFRSETLPIPNEDQGAVDALSEQWHGYYQPASPAEAEAIDRAVRASVQRRRCNRSYDAALADQVRAASKRWDDRQQEEVARLVARLAEEPAMASLRLKQTSAGLDYLLGRWRTLRASLLEKRGWNAIEREELHRLCGLQPGDRNACDVEVILRFRGAINDPRHDVPDLGAKYREWLCEAIDELTAELQARLQWLRDTYDAPSRAEAAERALVLQGPDAALLLRYEKAHELAFHRALGDLLKARADSRDDEKAADSDGQNALESGANGIGDDVAQPPAPNEPNPAGELSQVPFKIEVSDDPTVLTSTAKDSPQPVRLAVETAEEAAEVRPEERELFNLLVQACTPARSGRKQANPDRPGEGREAARPSGVCNLATAEAVVTVPDAGVGRSDM